MVLIRTELILAFAKEGFSAPEIDRIGKVLTGKKFFPKRKKEIALKKKRLNNRGASYVIREMVREASDTDPISGLEIYKRMKKLGYPITEGSITGILRYLYKKRQVKRVKLKNSSGVLSYHYYKTR